MCVFNFVPIRSDPMLIFLSGNRSYNGSHYNRVLRPSSQLLHALLSPPLTSSLCLNVTTFLTPSATILDKTLEIIFGSNVIFMSVSNFRVYGPPPPLPPSQCCFGETYTAVMWLSNRANIGPEGGGGGYLKISPPFNGGRNRHIFFSA